MAYCIAICNQKGGTGKTSSVIELAAGLSKNNKRVLVIDYDQQCNLSKYVDGDLEKNTIYDVLHANVSIEEAIQHVDGFDLIPASESLSRAEIEFKGTGDEYLLADVCEIVEDAYDYILIDNSPSRGILLTQSLIAANGIIIVTTCDTGSFDGISAIESDLYKLTSGRHKYSSAKVMGYILTMYEKTIMHEIAMEDLKELVETKDDPKPFAHVIHKSIVMSKVKTLQTSAVKFDKRSKPAKDYLEIAEEIIKRTK